MEASVASTAAQPDQPVEQEISFKEAIAEEEAATAPIPEVPQAEEKPKEDVLETLVPKGDPKLWQFGPNNEFEFVQRPLSFFGKMQWFALVGDVLDRALSGENAMSLNSLFDAPSRGGSISMSDFRDADTFVQAIGKLLVHAPDFLTQSYCIWLNVPDYQRDLVAQVWASAPQDGGMSDETGIEIIEVFIDQNYEALDTFFRELLGRLQRRVATQVDQASSSRRSKP